MASILYITNVKPPTCDCSSTDIMTNNLIYGLSQTSNNMTLLVLIDNNTDIAKTYEYYSKYVNRVLFLKRFFHDGQSKYCFLLGGLASLLLQRRYIDELKRVSGSISDIDIIIANKVTIDEVIYGGLIHKGIPRAKYYQFWSDPMALSGITRNQFSKMPRRWLFRFLEKSLISKGDLIVYGTRTLYLTQSAFYKTMSKKMRYIDICYSPNQSVNYSVMNNHLLYAGNYYSTIRNIIPLVEAISSQDKYKLDIYGNGDVDLSQYKNVEVHARVDRALIEEIESKYCAIICILNKTTSQIPGKVFYDMCSEKAIIVLTDGSYCETILDDLETYKRFKVCKNEYHNILDMLSSDCLSVGFDYSEIKEKYSPYAISMSLINGGKTIEDNAKRV